MILKFGISAKFHRNVPTFYGARPGHIQYLETSFARWLGKRGALPLMIPSVSEFSEFSSSELDPQSYAHEMDALVLQGGADVHPRLYGQEAQFHEYDFDEERDKYEILLIDAFVRANKPILGICRGFQLLNVYFGGTLYQDLVKSQFSQHLDKELGQNHTHEVELVPGGLFAEMYGGSSGGAVVSVHHQGIHRLGEGLTGEAHARPDGLVEAFSHQGDNFIVGVQWHPEFHREQNSEHLDAKTLFENLYRAAKNRKFFGTAKLQKRKKLKFGESSLFTLGGEIELQLVDRQTFDLKPTCSEIIAKVQSDRIKEEIFQSMIELESSVCHSAAQIEQDWQHELHKLLPVAEQLGAAVLGAGTHPFAKVSERILSSGARYQELVERNQWIARRIAIFGLHCHIGMSSPEEAIRYYRFYLSLSPLLLAMSCSSPFLEREHTGLASVRSTFFEATPAGGHPPILESWQQFEGLYSKMIAAGAIRSHKDLWWDVRPSLDYGTLEIRICDVMPSLAENAALIALIHVMGLAYHEESLWEYPWPALNEWSYRENKWRAARYGLDFDFIIQESAESIAAKDYLVNFLNDFESLANDLGYQSYWEVLRSILQKGNSSARQAAIYKRTDSYVAVTQALIEELKGNGPIWHSSSV